MGGRVVPLRLDKDVLEFVDLLVRLGVYSSRSEALRKLIKAGMRELGWIYRVVRGVEVLFELEEECGDIPFKLDGALKELLEERDRF